MKKGNSSVNYKDVLISRIQENASIAEIEEILGEQITGYLVEDLETHLDKALHELNDEALAEVIMKYLIPSEIGGLCRLFL